MHAFCKKKSTNNLQKTKNKKNNNKEKSQHQFAFCFTISLVYLQKTIPPKKTPQTCKPGNGHAFCEKKINQQLTKNKKQK